MVFVFFAGDRTGREGYAQLAFAVMLQRAIIVAALSLVLPLAGAVLAGNPAGEYLGFPPEGQKRDYPGFSWAAFVVLWLFAAALGLFWPFGKRTASAHSATTKPGKRTRSRFPAWGWLGLALCLVFWAGSWLPPESSVLRQYAFPPLWLGYIVTANALLYMRQGRCPLTHETGLFLSLFPASALFWWLFEYLNRFVDNWIYLSAASAGPLEYVLHASLSFATVLPAVYSTRQLLGTCGSVQRALGRGPRGPAPEGRLWGVLCFALSALGMGGIGLAPAYLFPFLWVGPLGLWIGLQQWTERRHPWPGIAEGDWREFLGWAFAALICGFFWELWNFHALPKWEYQIPWFERFHLFEMPISGYLGYLPFGLECAVAVRILRNFLTATVL